MLFRSVDDGHTVIVIEHNLDVIAEADHVLDIGPEAGAEGGQITAQGTPEQIATHPTSRTAPFLAAVLRNAALPAAPAPKPPKPPAKKKAAKE